MLIVYGTTCTVYEDHGSRHRKRITVIILRFMLDVACSKSDEQYQSSHFRNNVLYLVKG